MFSGQRTGGGGGNEKKKTPFPISPFPIRGEFSDPGTARKVKFSSGKVPAGPPSAARSQPSQYDPRTVSSGSS